MAEPGEINASSNKELGNNGEQQVTPPISRQQAQRSHHGNQIVRKGHHDLGLATVQHRTYARMTVGGSARVHNGDHNGDQITVNNYQTPESMQQDLERIGRARAEAQIAAAAFVVLLAETAMYLLRFLQYFFTIPPPQVQQHFAIFEDAHGKLSHIDITFVIDWTAFNASLARSFLDQPGYGRVLSGSYRLFDRYLDQRLIDPSQAPSFKTVFRNGRHIRMSMHFESDEVTSGSCPRCHLETEALIDQEIICARCNFAYRSIKTFSQAPPDPTEDLDSTAGISRGFRPSSVLGRCRTSNEAIARASLRVRDDPSQFQRISISSVVSARESTRLDLHDAPIPDQVSQPWVAMYSADDVLRSKIRERLRDVRHIVEDTHGNRREYHTRDEAKSTARPLQQEQQRLENMLLRINTREAQRHHLQVWRQKDLPTVKSLIACPIAMPTSSVEAAAASTTNTPAH